MLSLLVVCAGAFFFSYSAKVESYNSTILAFSYKYGFISRGFVGSIYQILDLLLPVDMMNYEAVVAFTLSVTLLSYGLLLFCFWKLLKNCKKEDEKIVEYLILFVMLVVVMTFSSKRNFGRLDLYMIVLTMLAVWSLCVKKAEWIVVICSALSVMIHQGYVFLYFNLILVLLVYRILTEEKKKKYITLFVVSFLVGSALFLWFELFSHGSGTENLNAIITDATALSRGGEYHETLIDHEILGLDVTEKEWSYHIMNWVELPMFLLLVMPYIILGVKFWKQVWKSAVTKNDKLKYFVFMAGVITLAPCFLMKVDYARWYMALVIYYLVILMAAVVMHDEIICRVLHRMLRQIKEEHPEAFLLILYGILFLPFWDTHVDSLLRQLSNPINEIFLHAWPTS